MPRKDHVARTMTGHPVMQASLATWGWAFHISETCTGSDVRVFAVPCIADHEIPATALPLFADAQALPQGQLEGRAPSAGASEITPAAFPAPMHTTLQSISCRYAVMFGDVLDRVAMRDVVRDLAATQLPFHCAHGRPTTSSLVQIHALHKLLEGRRFVVEARSGGVKPPRKMCLKARVMAQLH